MPVIGERSVAPSSAVSASLTLDLASLTEARSAARSAEVVDESSSAVVSVDCALARVAFALASVEARSTVSIVPSTWPLVTLSPTETRTEVTSAVEPKLTSSLSAGVRVPVVDTDSRTVAVDADTSRVVSCTPLADCADELVRTKPPTPPPMSTTAAARYSHVRRPSRPVAVRIRVLSVTPCLSGPARVQSRTKGGPRSLNRPSPDHQLRVKTG